MPLLRFSRREYSLQREATASNSLCVLGQTLIAISCAVPSETAGRAGHEPTVVSVRMCRTRSVCSKRYGHQNSSNNSFHVNLL
jgi:hypothetical protein